MSSASVGRRGSCRRRRGRSRTTRHAPRPSSPRSPPLTGSNGPPNASASAATVAAVAREPRAFIAARPRDSAGGRPSRSRGADDAPHVATDRVIGRRQHLPASAVRDLTALAQQRPDVGGGRGQRRVAAQRRGDERIGVQRLAVVVVLDPGLPAGVVERDVVRCDAAAADRSCASRSPGSAPWAAPGTATTSTGRGLSIGWTARSRSPRVHRRARRISALAVVGFGQIRTSCTRCRR